MSGYMHPGWDGVKPWEGILPEAPPRDPTRRTKASHRPVPDDPRHVVPGPARPYTRPEPVEWDVPPWLAAEQGGADCVGPGADWDRDAWRER